MKRTYKQLLALLMALVMALSLLPTAAFATTGETGGEANAFEGDANHTYQEPATATAITESGTFLIFSDCNSDHWLHYSATSPAKINGCSGSITNHTATNGCGFDHEWVITPKAGVTNGFTIKSVAAEAAGADAYVKVTGTTLGFGAADAAATFIIEAPASGNNYTFKYVSGSNTYYLHWNSGFDLNTAASTARLLKRSDTTYTNPIKTMEGFTFVDGMPADGLDGSYLILIPDGNEYLVPYPEAGGTNHCNGTKRLVLDADKRATGLIAYGAAAGSAQLPLTNALWTIKRVGTTGNTYHLTHGTTHAFGLTTNHNLSHGYNAATCTTADCTVDITYSACNECFGVKHGDGSPLCSWSHLVFCASSGRTSDHIYFFKYNAADKTALNDLLSTATTLSAHSTYYSADTWNAVETAKTTADSVNSNATATQAQVDAAAAALQTAINALEPGLTIPGYSRVKTTADLTDGYYLVVAPASDYNYYVLRPHIWNADAPLTDMTYQLDLSNAESIGVSGPDNSVALDNMVYKIRPSTRTTSKWVLEHGNDMRFGSSGSHNLWHAKAAACTDEKDEVSIDRTAASGGSFRIHGTNVDHNPHQEVYLFLNSSKKFTGSATISGQADLLFFKMNGAYKGILQEQIAVADTYTPFQPQYSEESWAALANALSEANTVNDNADATQEQVDAATTALQTAIDGLKLSLPGYTQVTDISQGLDTTKDYLIVAEDNSHKLFGLNLVAASTGYASAAMNWTSGAMSAMVNVDSGEGGARTLRLTNTAGDTQIPVANLHLKLAGSHNTYSVQSQNPESLKYLAMADKFGGNTAVNLTFTCNAGATFRIQSPGNRVLAFNRYGDSASLFPNTIDDFFGNSTGNDNGSTYYPIYLFQKDVTAADRTTLQVTVKEANADGTATEAAIENATVRVLNTSYGQLDAVNCPNQTTAADGTCSVTVPKTTAGLYTVQVTAEGYSPVTVNGPASNGDTVDGLNVALSPLDATKKVNLSTVSLRHLGETNQLTTRDASENSVTFTINNKTRTAPVIVEGFQAIDAIMEFDASWNKNERWAIALRSTDATHLNFVTQFGDNFRYTHQCWNGSGNGAYQSADAVGPTFGSNVTRHFKVKLVGDTADLWIDGVHVLNARDLKSGANAQHTLTSIYSGPGYWGFGHDTESGNATANVTVSNLYLTRLDAQSAVNFTSPVEGGTFTVKLKDAASNLTSGDVVYAGDTVVVTATPESISYELGEISYTTTADGVKHVVTADSQGNYSFVMPSGAVTVAVEFTQASFPVTMYRCEDDLVVLKWTPEDTYTYEVTVDGNTVPNADGTCEIGNYTEDMAIVVNATATSDSQPDRVSKITTVELRLGLRPEATQLTKTGSGENRIAVLADGGYVIDDTASIIKFSWVADNTVSFATDTSCYGDTKRWHKDLTATDVTDKTPWVEIPFYGTGIAVDMLTARNQVGGIDVLLDGVQIATTTAKKSSATLALATVFSKRDIPLGLHFLRLNFSIRAVTGVTSGDNHQINFDCFKVYGNQERTVTVPTDITGGTVTAKIGGAPVTTAHGGQTVTVDVTTDTGFDLGAVTYTPEGGTATAIMPAEGVYSFTMPEKNVTVGATFTREDRRVTFVHANVTLSEVTVTVDGQTVTPTISEDGDTYTVPYGATVTFKAAANEHYNLQTVAAGGQPLTADSNGVYTVQVSDADVVVAVAASLQPTPDPVFAEGGNADTLTSVTDNVAEFTLSETPAEGTTYKVYNTNQATELDPITGATVTQNGTTLTLTLPSAPEANGAVHTYYITATAQGGYPASNRVPVTVTAYTKKTDATLSGLTLSAGTLSPEFASGTTTYTATVGSAVDSVTVTPTVTEDSNATAVVKVGETEKAGGVVDGLTAGENTIKVVVTAENGTTGTYTITLTRKIKASVTAAPTGNTLTYTGGAQALVTAGTASEGSTMQYSLTLGTGYSDEIPTGTTVGSYTVYYKAVATDPNTHEDSDESSVTVTIGKGAQTAPGANEGYTIDYAQETISIGTGYEVSATQNDFTTLVNSGAGVTPGGTLYIRKAGNANQNASEAATITIPARPTVPETVKIVNEDEGVTLSNEYSHSANGATGWIQGEGNVVPVDPEASVYVRKNATSDAFKSEAKRLTAPARAETPTVAIDYAAETLNTTVTLEYKVGEGAWTTCGTDMPVSTAEFGWDGTAAKTVQFRVKATTGDDGKYASDPVNVTIPVRPVAPSLGVAAPETYDGKGKITGLESAKTYQYRVKTEENDGAWTDVSGQTEISLPADTTYEVRLAAVTTGGSEAFASSAAEVTVPAYTKKAISGTVTIDGTPTFGETLTANTTQVDAKGATLTYQWKRTPNGADTATDITDATNETYTLTAADIGATITVTVQADDLNNYTDAKLTSAATAVVAAKTMTVTADNVTATYDGTAKSITVAVTESDGTTVISDATITYKTAADGEYSATNPTFTNVTPETIVYYKVVKEGYTPVEKQATVTITAANLEGDIAITGNAKFGETLTADLTGLTPAGATVTYAWTVGTTLAAVCTTNNYEIKATDVGKIITLTVTGTGNYTGTKSATTTAVAAKTMTVTADDVSTTYDGTARSIAVTVMDGATDITDSCTITYGTTAGTYNLNTAPTFTNVTAATTVYYKVVKEGYTPVENSATVTITAANLEGTVTITGTATVGQELTAAVTCTQPNVGENWTYQWKRTKDAATTAIDSATSATYTLTADDVGATITVAVETTNANYTGPITSDPTAAVTKKPAPAAPTDLGTVSCVTGQSNGKITGVKSTMEYQKSGETGWTTVTGVEITGLDAGTYKVRVKETTETNVGAEQTVTVNEKAAAPTTLHGNPPSTENATDGSITGLDNTKTYEYRTTGTGDDAWQDVTGQTTIADLSSGSYEVRVKATGAVEASDIVTVPVPASGEHGIIITTPAHGSVTVDGGDLSAAQGAPITLIVNPEEGYQLGTLTVTKASGGTVEVTGNAFTMPNENVTITATFVLASYDITVSSPMTGGAVTARVGGVTVTSAHKGESVTLTVNPEEGYRLKAGTLKVTKTGDDTTAVAVTDNAFTMPAYGVTVSAEFELLSYDLTATVKDLTATAATTVTHGTDATVTLAAKPGYVLPETVTVKMGDATLTSGYTYDKATGTVTVANVTGAVTVTASGVADVVAANLADNRTEGALTTLYSDYEVTGTASDTEGVIDVLITAADLRKHANTDGVVDYWVGLGMPTGGAVSYYVSETEPTAENPGTEVSSVKTRTQETGGKTYNTLYISPDNGAFSPAWVTVKSGDTVLVKYHVTFHVEMVEEVVVTFDVNGGAATTDADYTQSVVVGQKPAKPANDPTKNGHTFMGWFTAGTGGTAITDFPAVESKAPVTYYAQWLLTPTNENVTVNVTDAAKTLTAAVELNGAAVDASKYTVTYAWYACDASGVKTGSVLGTNASYTCTETAAGTYYYLCEVTVAITEKDTVKATVTSEKAEVVVAPTTIPATDITLSKATVTVNEGTSDTVTATIVPGNSTDTLSAVSNNTGVATVSLSGNTITITGVAQGTTTVTVTAGSVTETINVTVNEVTTTVPATGITLDKTAVTVNEGATDTVTVTVTPSDTTDTVTVTSAATGTATATYADGTITIRGVAAGSTTVTVTAGSITETINVTVNEVTTTVPATAITVNPASVELTMDGTETADVTVTVTPADTTDTVTVTSSDSSVATASLTGTTLTITAVGAGTATITVRANDSVSATVSVTVTAATPEVKTVESVSITGTAQVGETLTANVTLSDGATATDADVTYQWYTVDGETATAIETATGATYQPVAADVGKQIKITVTAKEGGDYTGSATSGLTAAVVAAGSEVTEYTVTAATVEGGTITVSATSAAAGAEITVTLAPNEGYQLVAGSLKVYQTGDETTTVDVTDGKFTMPAYNVTVTAEFEAVTPPTPVAHDITVTKTGNGTVTLSKNSAVENEEITLTVTPTTEGATVSVTSDDVTLTAGANNTWTFTMPNKAVAITVTITEPDTPPTPEVDKGELETLYNANKDKTQGNYTDESWAAFTEALDAAKTVLDDADATQDEVDAAKAALDAAIKGLTEKPAPTPGGNLRPAKPSEPTTPEVVTKPDGSTETTVTAPDGTVTVTTEMTDGTTEVVETKPDGTKTETVTTPDGTETETVTTPEGTVTTTVTEADGTEIKTEAAPEKDTTVTVTLPEGKTEASVTVPVEIDYTTVAINTENGNIVNLSVPTEHLDAMQVKVEGNVELTLVQKPNGFVDIGGHWAENEIDFAAAHEFVNGTTPTTFSPNAEMTRGMMVTILARVDGADTTGGATWYDAGKDWAVSEGISDGTHMEDLITREQLATMLWRYAGCPEASGELEFVDAGSVSGYAATAMRWAVENGIFQGIGNNILAPRANASRAQAAAVILRFCALLVK